MCENGEYKCITPCSQTRYAHFLGGRGGVSFQIWRCPCHLVGIASHPCPAEPQRLARSERRRRMRRCRLRRPECQTPLAAQRARKRRTRTTQKLKPLKPVRVLHSGGASVGVGAAQPRALQLWGAGFWILGCPGGEPTSSCSSGEPWEDQDLLERRLEASHIPIAVFS